MSTYTRATPRHTGAANSALDWVMGGMGWDGLVNVVVPSEHAGSHATICHVQCKDRDGTIDRSEEDLAGPQLHNLALILMSPKLLRAAQDALDVCNVAVEILESNDESAQPSFTLKARDALDALAKTIDQACDTSWL